MGVHVVRYKDGDRSVWGVVAGEEVFPIDRSYNTLAELLREGGIEGAKKALSQGRNGQLITDLELLSPVTMPSQIVCQGANYSTHRAEAGMTANRSPFNLIFTKAPSSMTGPHQDVLCPSHVKLLDYEIELGMIIRKEITEKIEITSQNLNEYIAGYVITNDISARDVQLIEGQWFKGKSYRTFCPTGPILYLFAEDEPVTIHDLELTLTVNGEVRQASSTEQLLYKPEETLTELSGIFNFYPGDLVLTGTPGGVALNLTSEQLELLMNPTVDYDSKKATLMSIADEDHRYLQHGDVMTCEIKSHDGAINLGVQENKVVFLNESSS